MLPRLCSPNHGAELWGAESLQRPTLTGPPAQESSNALLLQFLYILEKSLINSLVGVSVLLSRGAASFWCQVSFGPLLLCPNFGKRVDLELFLISF